MSVACKSSDLDPIPTSLVKDFIDILVTTIVSIVNLSVSEGCFPLISLSESPNGQFLVLCFLHSIPPQSVA